MGYTAADINYEITSQLNDPNNDVWDETMIASFVSDAQHLIVSLRPDASITTESMVLSLSSRQTVPSGGIRLIDVLMNTDGAPIQKTTRERMTDLVPGWTTETGSSIEFYMFDEENPLIFWVYPKPATAFSVDISYSAIPEMFTSGATSLAIPDIYISAIYEYVLYRCLSMETGGINLPKATNHLSNFYNAINMKAKSDSILQQVQQ